MDRHSESTPTMRSRIRRKLRRGATWAACLYVPGTLYHVATCRDGSLASESFALFAFFVLVTVLMVVVWWVQLLLVVLYPSARRRVLPSFLGLCTTLLIGLTTLVARRGLWRYEVGLIMDRAAILNSAILEHRTKHGELPDRLTDLVPDTLAELPSGLPDLVYRPGVREWRYEQHYRDGRSTWRLAFNSTGNYERATRRVGSWALFQTRLMPGR